MPEPRESCTLGELLVELQVPPGQIPSDDAHLGRPVAGVCLWREGETAPTDPDIVVVCLAAPGSPEGLSALAPLLETHTSLIIALAADPETISEARRLGGHHVIFRPPTSNVGDVMAVIIRATQPVDEAVSRRLGALQRSLNQALTESAPIPALLRRLKQVCNATAALLDARGRATHTTGPLPLAILFGEINRTSAETQAIAVDGWRGVAVRVNDPAGDKQFGWLVVTARRRGFPNTYSTSAAHLAASLVEASQRMDFVAKRQDRAVRSSVLAEALALRIERHDAELAGRIVALGMTFEQELRVVAIRPHGSSQLDRIALEELADKTVHMFEGAGVKTLVAVLDDTVVAAAQCSLNTLRRLVNAQQAALPPASLGVGRPVAAVGQLIDSLHDAQLAIRRQHHRPVGQSPAVRLLAYEDFDFAARLFSEVGLERMVAWADDLLRPLESRDQLLEGLQTYVEHEQNMNAAANALNIHHNSLRYRLSKAEGLLGVSLKDPAAIASIYLALTARELSRPDTARLQSSRRRALASPETDASGSATDIARQRRERLGVVYGPER